MASELDDLVASMKATPAPPALTGGDDLDRLVASMKVAPKPRETPIRGAGAFGGKLPGVPNPPLPAGLRAPGQAQAPVLPPAQQVIQPVQAGAPPILAEERPTPAPRGIINSQLSRPAGPVEQGWEQEALKLGDIPLGGILPKGVAAQPIPENIPVRAYREAYDLIFGFNKLPPPAPGSSIPDALENGVLKLVGGLSEPETIAVILGGAGLAKYIPEIANLPKVAAALKNSPALAQGLDMAARGAVPGAFAVQQGIHAGEAGVRAYEQAKEGNVPGAVEAGVEALGSAGLAGAAGFHARNLGREAASAFPTPEQRVANVPSPVAGVAGQIAETSEVAGRGLAAEQWRRVAENNPIDLGGGLTLVQERLRPGERPYYAVIDQNGNTVRGGTKDFVQSWLVQQGTPGKFEPGRESITAGPAGTPAQTTIPLEAPERTGPARTETSAAAGPPAEPPAETIPAKPGTIPAGGETNAPAPITRGAKYQTPRGEVTVDSIYGGIVGYTDDAGNAHTANEERFRNLIGQPAPQPAPKDELDQLVAEVKNAAPGNEPATKPAEAPVTSAESEPISESKPAISESKPVVSPQATRPVAESPMDLGAAYMEAEKRYLANQLVSVDEIQRATGLDYGGAAKLLQDVKDNEEYQSRYDHDAFRAAHDRWHAQFAAIHKRIFDQHSDWTLSALNAEANRIARQEIGAKPDKTDFSAATGKQPPQAVADPQQPSDTFATQTPVAEKPQSAIPQGLAWKQPLSNKDFATPEEYYDAYRTRQQGDLDFISGEQERLARTQGKKGAPELRRQISSEVSKKRDEYGRRQTEVELTLGVKAAAQMRADVEGRRPPETVGVPAKEGYHKFWNTLDYGDTIQAPDGPIEITKADAMVMQPVIPGGPGGKWGAVGPGHREVMTVEGRMPDGKIRKFDKRQMEQHLGLEQPAGPKISQIMSPGVWADSFDPGQRVSFTWNGKRVTGEVTGRQGDQLKVQTGSGISQLLTGNSARQDDVQKVDIPPLGESATDANSNTSLGQEAGQKAGQNPALNPTEQADLDRTLTQIADIQKQLGKFATSKKPAYLVGNLKHLEAKRDRLQAKQAEPKKPVTPQIVPGKAPTAVPKFKEGDKVQWTGPRGEVLTGTVEDDHGDGTYQVDRDQIVNVGGRMPIHGSSRVRQEALAPIGEAAPAHVVENPTVSKILSGSREDVEKSIQAVSNVIRNMPDNPGNQKVEIDRLENKLVYAHEHLDKLKHLSGIEADKLREVLTRADNIVRDWKAKQGQTTPEEGTPARILELGDDVLIPAAGGTREAGTVQAIGVGKGGGFVKVRVKGKDHFVPAESVTRPAEPTTPVETPATQVAPQSAAASQGLSPEDIIKAAQAALAAEFGPPEPTEPAAKGYRFLVKGVGEKGFTGGNAQVFASEAEATKAAQELRSRWFGMEDFKIEPADEAPNYRFDDEKYRSVPIEKPAPPEAPAARTPLGPEAETAAEIRRNLPEVQADLASARDLVADFADPEHSDAQEDEQWKSLEALGAKYGYTFNRTVASLFPDLEPDERDGLKDYEVQEARDDAYLFSFRPDLLKDIVPAITNWRDGMYETLAAVEPGGLVAEHGGKGLAGEEFKPGQQAAAPTKAPAKKAPRAPKADPQLERRREFYTPGNVIHVNYWNSFDKVLQYDEKPDRSWRVQVVHTDEKGNPVPGDQPRWHATEPDKRDYIAIKGTAPAPAPAPKPPTGAAATKLDKAADEAMARLRKKMQGLQAQAGIDPQDLIDMTTVGARLIVKGFKAWKDWVQQIMEPLGGLIKQFAKATARKVDALLREIHSYALATARQFGVEGEPPPARQPDFEQAVEDLIGDQDLAYSRSTELMHSASAPVEEKIANLNILRRYVAESRPYINPRVPQYLQDDLKTSLDRNDALVAKWGPRLTAPAPPPTDESALIPEARKLITAFRSIIRQGSWQIDNNIHLMDVVKEITGRSPADGSIDTKQVYDLLETAVNQEIAENGRHLMQASTVPTALHELRNMLDRLPTQAIRSDEQIRFQQFSTPPTEALVAARVLGIRPDDLVLEPSAGTGGLAAFARAAGATVLTNEITPRRAALLGLSGYNVTQGDAEQIDNSYDEAFPDYPDPTAVLMNPPFSAAGARGTANTNEVGYRHVLQALRRLRDGGRLVAILGEGSTLQAPTAREFFQKIRERGLLRANVGINGKEYAKYGTTFGNRLIVIDKIPALSTGKAPLATGDYDTLEDAWKALSPVAADRVPLPATAKGLSQQPGAGVGHGAAGSRGGAATGSATGGVREPGGQPGTAVRGGRTSGVVAPGGHEAGTGVKGAPGSESNVRPENAAGANSAVSSGNADVGPAGPAQSQLVKSVGEDIGDYVAYTPTVVPASWGAKPHNAIIVETQTMASVPEPPLTMKPNIPHSVIASGDLSDVQLAVIAHAIQAHELFSKNGRRIGFFSGDGTGVGKGRENAGLAVHYWRTLPEGKRRTVWVSFNEELAEAARDDLDNVGGKQIPIYSLEKVKVGKTIPYKDGVLFVPYSKLAAQQNTKADGTAFKKGSTKAERAAGQKQMRRLQQIMDWAGEEPLIIFDEAHKAKNATTTETEIPGQESGGQARKAKQKPTATGLATIELQNKVPKARVMYSSATGFSDVSNMAYANRLDAWGEGTSFKDFEDFRSQVSHGGVGVMELVARGLKAQGKYLSRFISYKGVKFEEKTHEISADQHRMVDKAGDAWRMVIDRFNQASEETTSGTDDSGSAKGSVKAAAMSQLYGAQLRFYRSLYTAMKVPTLIKLVDEAMDAGKSVVISVLETGQAQQDRELQRVMQQDDEDLEGADLSPIASLVNMVDSRFPTIEYETVEDPDTHEKITRPVKYIDKNGVERVQQNAEALKMKKALLDELEKLKGEFPDAALDQIINKYGSQAVAEMTKRSERLVRNSQTGKREVQSRGSDLTKTNLAEMNAFQDGKKRIAIISNAASTGISLHSSIRAKNQQQRVHIMLQLKWSADMTLQDLGRTHRTAQVIPPEYVLLSLNVEAEKRFAATIARRLEQLGALSRGERKAGGGATDFSKYNFESKYGTYGVDQLVDTLFSGTDRFGFLNENRMAKYPELADGPHVLDMLGLHETDKDGDEVAPTVPVKRFFNRMMILPINMGNQLFQAFFETMEHLIDRSKQLGQFDAGAEKIKAEHLEQDGEPIVVHENPTTKAQAVYYKVNARNPRHRYAWDEARSKVMSGTQDLVRVKASGRLLTVGPSSKELDSDTGSMRQVAWGYGASGTFAHVHDDQVGPDEKQKFEAIPREQADTHAAEWQAQYDAAGPWLTTPYHLITGDALSIWNKIQEREGSGKSETAKPLQVKIGHLDSGDRLIGVDVAPHRIAQVLKGLGHEVTLKPEDVAKQVMAGKKFNLSQGATLKRSKVSGDYRMELEGATHFQRLFPQWGLHNEIIASKSRWFIPTGEAGSDVLKRVLKELPVTGGEQEGEEPAKLSSEAGSAPMLMDLANAIAKKFGRPARGPEREKDPWKFLAQTVNGLSDEDLLKAYHDDLAEFLHAVEGQGGIPEDVSGMADQVAKQGDAGDLRTLLAHAFTDASNAGVSGSAAISAAARNSAGLKALKDADDRLSDRAFPEKSRTFVTGERDIRIAEGNQLRDRLKRLVKDPKQQEAISLMRDFKNRPGELEQFREGSHQELQRLHPDERKEAMERIGKLDEVVDLALNPTPEMLQADKALTDFFTAHLKEGKKLGMLDSSLTNEEYITHLLAPKEKPGVIARAAAHLGRPGKVGPKKFRYSKERKIPTLLHAVAYGVPIRTLNAFDAMTIYNDKYAASAAARLFEMQIKRTGVGMWGTGFEQREGRIPTDWVELAPESGMYRHSIAYNDKEGNARLAQQHLFVPPELEKAMRPVFQPDYLTQVPGYSTSKAYQSYIKSVELSLSAFHIKAMTLAALGNEGPTGLVKAWMSDMESPEFEAKEREFVHAGLTTPILGRTMEAYKALTPSSLPTGLDKVRSAPLIHQVDQAAQAITHLTFDVLQRKSKVIGMAIKDAAWLSSHPGASLGEHYEAQRQIAKEINAVFGGLHWENMGINRTTLGLARLLMLAPDWTFSNWATAKYAFEGGPGGNAARMFWIKTAILVFGLTAATSLLLSGKLSKDPTRVNMGKDKQGRDITQNIFATGAAGDLVNLLHYTRDSGLVVGSAHFLANKLGNFSKAALHQLANADALGRAIRVRGESAAKNTVRGASQLAKDIVPVPFGLSTAIRMATDPKKKYSLSEYLGTVLGGTPPTREAPAKPVHHRKAVPWTVPLSSVTQPRPEMRA